MSDEQHTSKQRTSGDGGEPEVKVQDRRRFTQAGDPLPDDQTDAGTDTGAAALAEASAEDVRRDEQMAQQAARIDELTRAYAALLDESKAARRRMEREKERVLEAERSQVAQVLLEAVDGIERVLAAAGETEGPLVDGVRLTLAALEKKVSELGAVRMAVVGQRFDPRLAEAVDVVPVSSPGDDDVVVEEIRAGYRIGDRVLRPARVRVGRLAQA